MSTEIHHQHYSVNQHALYKMDSEFWHQGRGPPLDLYGAFQSSLHASTATGFSSSNDQHIQHLPHAHIPHSQQTQIQEEYQHFRQPIAEDHHHQQRDIFFDVTAASMHLTNVMKNENVNGINCKNSDIMQKSQKPSLTKDYTNSEKKELETRDSVNKRNEVETRSEHQTPSLSLPSPHQHEIHGSHMSDINTQSLNILQHKLQNQLQDHSQHKQQNQSKNLCETTNNVKTIKNEEDSPFANKQQTHSENQQNSVNQCFIPNMVSGSSFSMDQTQHEYETALDINDSSERSNKHETNTDLMRTTSSASNPKYENSKLTNDAQLQLSRSNSAAAISERTLEECWSTLQRLFMHKSAMQQIQQMPCVPLGGVTGTGNGLGGESKPHQCQQCLKSFSSNHQLVQHIRVHTGEKPYKCSYCDRRFKQLSHVQQHTRLHTGERPYKCHLPDCGRAFIQLSNLQQHLRNHDAQVERAKNRPYHCNICGKGFATESSLRTHTSKELQLHLGVLQQHAALIGGPNATSCPVCHKLFLGTEALVDHMKHYHKETPTASNSTSTLAPENMPPSSCMQVSSNDPFSAKRRLANHPCPVCGKQYVNEGSLRKHLACHSEVSQRTNNLRMWPCSVCQAVFTLENGLLTHMEHMRMDPKHQFAAQYVLSRAAAERRERNSVNDTMAVLADGRAISHSIVQSPSGDSDCSSNDHLSSSSAYSENGSKNDTQAIHISQSKSNSDIRKFDKMMHSVQVSNANTGSSTSPEQYGVENDFQTSNRMSLMAASAAAVAAAAVVSETHNKSKDENSSGTLTSTANIRSKLTPLPSQSAVQAAVVNLAAAMRINRTSSQVSTAFSSGNLHSSNSTCENNKVKSETLNSTSACINTNISPTSAIHVLQNNGVASVNAVVAMNAMRDTIMRCSNSGLDNFVASSEQQQVNSRQQHAHPSSQQTGYSSDAQENAALRHHQLQSPQTSFRMQQQAEAIFRSHTEVALRLAASVAQATSLKENTSVPPFTNDPLDARLVPRNQQESIMNDSNNNSNKSTTLCDTDIESTRVGEGADILRPEFNNVEQLKHKNKCENSKIIQSPQLQQNSIVSHIVHSQQHQDMLLHPAQNLVTPQHSDFNSDLSETLRLQEQRIEQALRLHNEVRNLNFLTAATTIESGTVPSVVPHQVQEEIGMQQIHHST